MTDCKSFSLALLTSLAIGLGLAAAPTTGAATVLLVEAEDFQFPGNWGVEQMSGASGDAIVKTNDGDAPALTVIDVPADGRYALWTRSRCYASNQPGTRRYQLTVDGQPAERESGIAAKDGLVWERVGEAALAKGQHVVGLLDTTRFFGRCDAVLLVDDERFDPTPLGPARLAKSRVKPVDVKAAAGNFPKPPRAVGVPTQVAALEGANLRVAFDLTHDESGKPLIVRRAQVKAGAHWRDVSTADEQIFALFDEDPQTDTTRFSPSWPNSRGKLTFEVDGKRYESQQARTDPFLAGQVLSLTARSARTLPDGAVELTHDHAAVSRWSLADANRSDVVVNVSMTADSAGHYSIGFTPFAAVPADRVKFNLLLPMYQYLRRPPFPEMLTSSVTPHPLALTEQAGEGGPLTLAVVADPGKLPLRWANHTNAVYGFSLLGPGGQSQPSAFSPVLGLEGSKQDAGATVSATFHVLSVAGDWRAALERATTDIMGVTDTREPVGTSLTEAALNMIDLLRDANACGWDAELKGFYNVESQHTVSQASPLTMLSVALLSDDEEFYWTRALPTIEWTLSRSGAHHAASMKAGESPYLGPANVPLTVPSRFYGTAYWQGLNTMTGGANPWAAEMATPGGKTRHDASYSSIPTWSESLAAYRLDPVPGRLETVRAEADEWIKTAVMASPTQSLGLMKFYNVSSYPYWWDLIDLYELTNERRYLDAAEQGAFGTLSGLWSHPGGTGDVTLHEKGKFVGENIVWWKDNERFRRGWPRKDGDLPVHPIPAWVVSPIGLGFEQPVTYFHNDVGDFRNILASSWAPSLLRLYRHTGREIYKTFARHGIIGRFANYPGYYLSGLTDVQLDPKYPYTGVDVTTTYYHHIPVHLQFTLDFLFAEMELAFPGQFDFPWVRQQGYVWFTNRVFGHAPGTLFGDPTARVRMTREVGVDTPAVTHLLARGRDRAYVLLVNETPRAVSAGVRLDAEALGIVPGARAELLMPDGAVAGTLAVGDDLKVELAPRAAAALRIAASPRADHWRAPSPPSPFTAATAHVTLNPPPPLGAVHVFRIRSPFGRDSIYVVLTGQPDAGTRLTVAPIDARSPRQPMTDDAFPYECTLRPVGIDEDVELTVTINRRGQTAWQSPSVHLPGDHPAPQQ